MYIHEWYSPYMEVPVMKSVTIALTDAAHDAAEQAARTVGVDVASFCSLKLSETLVTELPACRQPYEKPTTKSTSPEPSAGDGVAHTTGVTSSGIREAFAGYPEKSIRYAEKFVEEACKLPGVIAKFRPNGRGIIFEPNFVSVEYLRTRAGAGIAASFGAPVRKYRNAPQSLKRGRTESYSWVLVDSDEMLDKVLPLIRQTWEIRRTMGYGYSSAR
jgi:hypothetical protein